MTYLHRRRRILTASTFGPWSTVAPHRNLDAAVDDQRRSVARDLYRGERWDRGVFFRGTRITNQDGSLLLTTHEISAL